MANLLNQPAPQQAAPTYSQADIRAAQAETAAQLLAAENQRLQQAALYRPPVQQAPRPMGPDPLKLYAEKNLTLTADENARLMDQGIRGRARYEAANAVEQAKQELRGEMAFENQKMALDSILAANPDMAQDAEGYAAAIGKAQFRTSNQNLDPIATARLAAQIYRQERAQYQQQVPYVEGAGRPQAGFGQAAPETPKANFYQEFYGGANTDEELIDKPWNNDEQVLIYLDGKNAELETMGAEPMKSKIRDVQGETMMRRSRTKQRGAA